MMKNVWSTIANGIGANTAGATGLAAIDVTEGSILSGRRHVEPCTERFAVVELNGHRHAQVAERQLRCTPIMKITANR